MTDAESSIPFAPEDHPVMFLIEPLAEGIVWGLEKGYFSNECSELDKICHNGLEIAYNLTSKGIKSLGSLPLVKDNPGVEHDSDFFC
jgi:hypothetical protein